MKFGGTSLEDGIAFERVALIVRLHAREGLVVVASAMSGVTEALITAVRDAAKGASPSRSLEEHFERHLKVASALGATARERMRVVVEQSKKEIIELLSASLASRMTIARLQDSVTSHGERLSANLLAIVLEEFGIRASYVDARRCILTNEDYGSAQPLMRETALQTRAELKPLLETRRVPVLGGFIGATRNSVTTTLGRGSSDYSATLVSAALGARETQIWTDVDGVKTADPCLVKAARTVPHLSYEEAAELARLGARVLHPKMFEPVLQQQIPIRIRNSRSPQQSGTLICTGSEASGGAVKAIAYKTNLTTIDITSTPTFIANGFLHAVKEIFTRHRTQMNLVAKSDLGISCAHEEDGSLPSIVEDLKKVGAVAATRHRAMISCVGAGLDGSPDKVMRVRSILSDIEPSLTWRSTSGINLISVVDADSVSRSLRRLHQGIFESDQSVGE